MEKLYSKYVLWGFRIFVSVLFIISGMIKVNDIIGFAYKLEEYFNVFQNDFGLPADWFTPWVVLNSALISIFEVALALALLVGWRPRLTMGIMLALIVFFTFLTGYSWILERVQDCGCFGDALKLTPKQSFFKDVILLVLIGYLFVFRDRIRPLFSPGVTNAVTGAGTLLVVFITWYCYAYLPIIDFRPAALGDNLQVNTEELFETQPDVYEPRLKSYVRFGDDCNGNEFEGQTLLIIMPKLHEADPDDLKHSVALARALEGQVKVMAGVSHEGGYDGIEAAKQKHGLNYCLSAQDETMLKTMIRANPGYILLRDAVIVGKWHANARPTVEEVMGKL